MWASFVSRKTCIQEHDDIPRVFDLISLLAVGVGGTVGSGIFVLSGTIASCCAGVYTYMSWLIAGTVCLVTALAYAELSHIIPSGGSTYSFAYNGLGQIFAVLGAGLLVLEYGFSGAAVARSWGDKSAFYLSQLGIAGCDHRDCWVNSLHGSPVNPAAGLLSLIVILVLLGNVQLGRIALNIMVGVKLLLVIFVIIVGGVYFDADNMLVQQSSIEGTNGIITGAALAFFGFIGFDEVTCLTLEAVNPARNVPMAVIGTLVIITLLYVAASVVLVGMADFNRIDQDEGFGSAFHAVGADWAMHVVMVGQIFVVLPAVVFVSYLPQSRLLYSISKDELLPRLFSQVEPNGCIFYGTLISGTLMTIVALFVPFKDLDNMICAGILLSFILTNVSLLFIRYRELRSPTLGAYKSSLKSSSPAVEDACGVGFGYSILFFTMLSGVHSYFLLYEFGSIAQILFGIATFISFIGIWFAYFRRLPRPEKEKVFLVPGVPLVPAIAIHSNWCLFAEIPPDGMIQLGFYLFVLLVLYIGYKVVDLRRFKHSRVATEDSSIEMT